LFFESAKFIRKALLHTRSKREATKYNKEQGNNTTKNNSKTPRSNKTKKKTTEHKTT
jgi:hypothetical protein